MSSVQKNTKESAMKWLNEIEERAKKATSGPWTYEYHPDDRDNAVIASDNHVINREADLLFAANSRADIPKLCEALRKAVEMAEYYKRSIVHQSDFWGNNCIECSKTFLESSGLYARGHKCKWDDDPETKAREFLAWLEKQ